LDTFLFYFKGVAYWNGNQETKSDGSNEVLWDRFFINDHDSDFASTADFCVLLFASPGNRIVSNFHPSAIVFPLPSRPKAIRPRATLEIYVRCSRSLKATRKLIKLENNKSKAEQNRSRRIWMGM